jgi:hypothetical protein
VEDKLAWLWCQEWTGESSGGLSAQQGRCDVMNFKIDRSVMFVSLVRGRGSCGSLKMIPSCCIGDWRGHFAICFAHPFCEATSDAEIIVGEVEDDSMRCELKTRPPSRCMVLLWYQNNGANVAIALRRMHRLDLISSHLQNVKFQVRNGSPFFEYNSKMYALISNLVLGVFFL